MSGRGRRRYPENSFKSLKAGKIAGAGLDVFDPEPPLSSNPLLAMENVAATPHTAGFTNDCQRAMGLGIAEEILAVLNGVRPSNLVNPVVWDSPARRGLELPVTA